MQSAAAFAEASGSDAAWKTLALRLADEAQTCLDNSHWEVKFGSGDMLTTIKAIRLMKEVEAAEHLNADFRRGDLKASNKPVGESPSPARNG